MGENQSHIRLGKYHSKCLEYISTKLNTTENAVIQLALDKFIRNNLLEFEQKRLMCDCELDKLEEQIPEEIT